MPEVDKSTAVSESQSGSKPRPVPRRVVDRPHPSRWDEQELMNFAEAVALFGPWVRLPCIRCAPRTAADNSASSKSQASF
jgi:hypothetical protein